MGSDEKDGLRPKDVKAETGLSYRQLHHWEAKGAASSERSNESGWRRYSPREVFVLLIAQEFRESFGIPLSRLRWMQEFMLQDGADHFRYVLERATDGMTVFLLTDLSETFVIDTDLEIADLFELGAYRDKEPSRFFLLKLNPLLDRVLKAAGIDNPLPRRDGYRVIAKARAIHHAITMEEIAILRLARMKDVTKFTVTFKDGEPHRAVVETEEEPNLDVLAAEEESPFQTITIKRSNGKRRKVIRQISEELPTNRDEATGKRLPLVIQVKD